MVSMQTLKRMLIGSLVVMWSMRIAAAGELPIASPSDVGLSPSKLNQAKEAVQALVDKKEVAGAILIVARHGKVVKLEGLGVMDLDSGKPMKPDTIVRIFSMTKPITTVAAMMLYEEGKFQLDDPVSKYLPELQGLRVYAGKGDDTVEAKREMTVRDLLRHTSGLTYGAFGSTPVDKLYQERKVLSDPNDALQDLVAKLGKIPLLYQPGTRFNYSVSTDVLGRLVEVLAKRELDIYFAERIFKPLDMKDTGFFVPKDQLERFAANHGPGEKEKLKVIETATTSRYRKRPKLLSGGGGLVSTARDYLRFCQMLLNGGELEGTRLLTRETIQTMTQNQLPAEAMPLNMLGMKLPGMGFGLGFGVRVSGDKDNPAEVVGEYYWGGAASTHFWISPRHDLIVIALEQYMPFNQRLAQTLKPIVYQAVVEPGTSAKEQE
jgi:CubicO group peptidase (beta-lactamase class C family)